LGLRISCVSEISGAFLRGVSSEDRFVGGRAKSDRLRWAESCASLRSLGGRGSGVNPSQALRRECAKSSRPLAKRELPLRGRGCVKTPRSFHTVVVLVCFRGLRPIRSRKIARNFRLRDRSHFFRDFLHGLGSSWRVRQVVAEWQLLVSHVARMKLLRTAKKGRLTIKRLAATAILVKTTAGHHSELRKSSGQFGQKWSNSPLVALYPRETEEERETQNERDVGSRKTAAVNRFKLGALQRNRRPLVQ
jgi:hypothetical protein